MKHRTLIEMLAFITVALLIIVLYFSGVTVFAYDDNTVKPIEKFNIDKICTSNNDFTEYSYNNLFLYSNNRSEVQTYTNIINNNPSLIDVEYMGGYFSTFSNYCWTTDGFFFCDDQSFLAVSNNTSEENTFYFHVSQELYNYLSSSSENYVWRAYVNSSIVNVNSHLQQVYASYCKLIDGEYYIPLGYHAQMLLNCNIMIYSFSGDTSRNVTTLQGAEAISNNYVPATDESENIRDHRNFNPAFMFINTNTNYGGDGLVTSLGYDKWQTNNLDRYKITWDYSLDFTVASSSESNTMHFVKNGYSQTLDNIPTGRFAMSLPEIFTTMYDGNTNCWNTIKDISMKTIKNDSSFGVAGGVDIGVANFELSANTPLTLDKAIGITEFKFYVTASIVTDDNLDCGTFGYTYDFLDGTYTNTSNFKNQDEVNTTISQYNHDNNLSSGDSGYLDITDYQSNMPASNNYPAVSGGAVSTGGSASAQGGVAYGSNVNNSVIVNTGQDAKEVIKYAKNELLPANYEGGYVEKLETVTDSNNFIQYMSTTFSFMPQTFWNDVAYYGKIALIILVSGFILSLVRKLIN